MITDVLKNLIASSVTEAVKKSVYYNEWFVITRSIFPSLQGLWGELYIFIFPFVACLAFSYMYHVFSPDLRDHQGCLLIHRVPKLSRYRPVFWNGQFLFSIVWTLQFDCNVQFNVFLDTHLMSVFLAHFRRSWDFFLWDQTAWGKPVMNICKCLPHVLHVILSRHFLKSNMRIHCPMMSTFLRFLYFCKGYNFVFLFTCLSFNATILPWISCQ